jgi:hypothetical protein
MPPSGFRNSVLIFDRPKAVRALDRVPIGIGVTDIRFRYVSEITQLNVLPADDWTD